MTRRRSLLFGWSYWRSLPDCFQFGFLWCHTMVAINLLWELMRPMRARNLYTCQPCLRPREYDLIRQMCCRRVVTAPLEWCHWQFLCEQDQGDIWSQSRLLWWSRMSRLCAKNSQSPCTCEHHRAWRNASPCHRGWSSNSAGARCGIDWRCCPARTAICPAQLKSLWILSIEIVLTPIQGTCRGWWSLLRLNVWHVSRLKDDSHSL